MADLDSRRHGFHVAIENWQHDLNIGTIVRTANAFLAAEVHIVGKKKWNRRGAMVTDRYQHVRHHPDPRTSPPSPSSTSCAGRDRQPARLDHRSTTVLCPRECILVFGQEGPGLSEVTKSRLDECRSIPQFGSTRSINAGVAAGIAMHEWIRTYATD